MMKNKELDKINDLIHAEQYEQAKELLNDVLENDDKDIEAKKLYALCEVNLENYNEARYVLEDVVKFEDNDALSWFYLGCCYDYLEDLILAKHAYLKVIELREEYVDAYKSLAIVYIKLEKYNEAVETAQKALCYSKEDFAIYYIIGTAHMASKNFDESVEYLQKAIELNPTNVQLYNNLGTSYLTIENYDKAIEIYEKVIEINNEDPMAYFNIASIYQVKNEHKKACEYFSKAYNLEQDENFLVAWAVSEVKAGYLTEAIEHYKYLASVYPQKLTYKYNLACCCDAAGEYQLAIALLNQLMVMSPKDVKILKKLANVYVSVGNLSSAKEINERIVKMGNVSYSIYYELATLCSQTGDIDRAETMLKKSCSLNPEFATAHKDLGVIYLNKRLFDYAKDEFELAYKYDKNNYSIVLEYANYLHAVSEFIEAEKMYDKAIELAPDSPTVLAFSALNKLHLKQIEEAKIRIKKVIEMHIDSAFIYYIAGRAYFLDKDFEESKMYLIKAYELEKLPDAESLLGECYLALGNYKQAKIIFEDMHKKSPLNINISLNLAKTYELLDMNEEARVLAEEIVEAFPECEEAQELIRRVS